MADIELIIKIPEDEYKYIKEYGLFGYGVPSTKCPVEDAIKNGTPIPDNATNGEVIKAMFDKGFFEDIFLEVMHYGDYKDRVSDWWNAPYQKGGKE